MSLVFWDHYLDLDDVNKLIINSYDNDDEKQEATKIIDEIVHHRLMGCVLSNLEHNSHNEFLEIFALNPSDEKLEEFLKNRIKTDFISLIKLEVQKIKEDILSIFHISKP